MFNPCAQQQISYVDISKPTFIRNQSCFCHVFTCRILKDGYGFRCNCSLCKNLQRDKRLYSFKCSCGGVQYPTIEECNKRPGTR